MPLLAKMFPQRSKRPRSSTTAGRSEGRRALRILPRTLECPALQGLSRSPAWTWKVPLLCRIPLSKVSSPYRGSGSKLVIDSFIYENWRVHPHSPVPRMAFEDELPCDIGDHGKGESDREKSAKHRDADALKRSVSGEGPSIQLRGIGARRCSGGGSAVMRRGRSKGQTEGHEPAEPRNKMKSVNIRDFYKRCKIDGRKKMRGSGVFKA
ncbi:hypothetical protein GJAV_G00238990 [Gymnothorax javanicus]|nr:hypothetical protein GJAV_G00238990 [Gymnothorax javanicus]